MSYRRHKKRRLNNRRVILSKSPNKKWAKFARKLECSRDCDRNNKEGM